jgi:hypothetical protein
MKITVNETEYDVRNPVGVEYIRSVFLATMKTRHGDVEKIEEIVKGLVKGEVPQRGSKGKSSDPLAKERTEVLKSLLTSAGIEANLRKNDERDAALTRLATHLGKTVEELTADIQARAEKRAELMVF